jgi:hypothetical protein
MTVAEIEAQNIRAQNTLNNKEGDQDQDDKAYPKTHLPKVWNHPNQMAIVVMTEPIEN